MLGRVFREAAGWCGAALLLVCGLLPWLRIPPGPSMNGFRSARILMALGDLTSRVPAWLGPLWYAIPMLGAGVLPLLTVPPPSRWSRLTILAGAVAAALSVLTLTAIIRAGDELRAGPLSALLGGLLLILARLPTELRARFSMTLGTAEGRVR